MKNLIVLAGLAGSGKTTAAKHLVEAHGYIRVNFADPLKAMLYALGLDKDHIDGEGKERPHTRLCGKTPRYAMQTLGTEWGRDMIGPDFWINTWTDRVRTELRGYDGYGYESISKVVADDCRFQNEADTARGLGGTVIHIDGRGGIPGVHQSESGVHFVDVTIKNDGTVDDLFHRLDAVSIGDQVYHRNPEA